MELVLKKYFWAVNLLGTLVMAWLVASAMNDWVAGKLFALPAPPHVEGHATAGGPAPRLGRIPNEEGLAQALVERSPFTVEAKDVEEPAEEEDTKDDAEDDAKPEGELEESTLPIDLVGTLVTEEPDSSMATLSVEGANKLAWIGSEFLDGKARVVAIAPRHVVVKEGGEFRVIRLWSDKVANAKGAHGRPGARPGRFGAHPAPGRHAPRPAPRVSSSKRNSFAKSVKKTGAYDYEIDRRMIDEQLQDLSKLGSQARIVPNYRGGKYQGFKLVGVRPGSLYRSIGIRSGDVIKAINGRPIDSPNKAIELFDQLKNSSNIQLEIERRGQMKQLNYAIK